MQATPYPIPHSLWKRKFEKTMQGSAPRRLVDVGCQTLALLSQRNALVRALHVSMNLVRLRYTAPPNFSCSSCAESLRFWRETLTLNQTANECARQRLQSRELHVRENMQRPTKFFCCSPVRCHLPRRTAFKIPSPCAQRVKQQ
jgi:hypothetical protein